MPHRTTVRFAGDRPSSADDGPMTTTWGAFASAEPDLAAFVASRLTAAPAYLATVRANGAPRVERSLGRVQ